jgi:hypothetical protein
MWIRCCIILHNLILRIEAAGVSSEWHEELYRLWDTAEGAEYRRRHEEALDEESDDDTELTRAQRQVTTDGQRFRRRLMNDLFDSPTSGAVRRT